MGSLWKKIRQASECKMLWFSNAKVKSLPDGGAINPPEALPRLLRLPIQDQARYISERHSSKESSIAVVQPQKLSEDERKAEQENRIEKGEVIKNFIQTDRTQSVGMLTDEVAQIQEVRYCLKTLRKQMAARQNSDFNKDPEISFGFNMPTKSPPVTNINNNYTVEDHTLSANAKLREDTSRLYTQLEEMEKRHREERDRLEAESNGYRICLAEQSVQLEVVELQSEEKGQQVEKLQGLLESMRIKSCFLKDKMEAGEMELLQIKQQREEEGENEKKCTELNNQLAVQKEKVHQLDDMLKSQQRKLRHMIEQLQQSRVLLHEKDRLIMDLEEKVAFLEAENKELHDHMEHFLGEQDPPALSTEGKPEVVYSKRLFPTSPTKKVLPYIKVIEIKS